MSYAFDTLAKAWERLRQQLPNDAKDGPLAHRFGAMLEKLHEADHRLCGVINCGDGVILYARRLDNLMHEREDDEGSTSLPASAARPGEGALSKSEFDNAPALRGLRNLALDMGGVIRSCTEADDHSELWTNDGDYVPDPRFSDERLALLARLECYLTRDDVGLPKKDFLALVAGRIEDDLRDGTYVGGPNSNEPEPADDGKRYKIVRHRFKGENSIIETGLTLAQAQAHCSRPDTKGEGWFDGYTEE